MSVSDTRKTSGEKDLLGRLATGDARALAELYDQHSAKLFELAVVITRSESLAEDVVSGAFAAAMGRGVGPGGEVRAAALDWLSSLVRSRAVEAVRGAPDARGRGSWWRWERVAGAERLSAEQKRTIELVFAGVGLDHVALLMNESKETCERWVRTGMIALREATRAEAPSAGRTLIMT